MLRITLQSYSICIFTQSHKNTSGFHIKRGTPKMSQSGLLIYGITHVCWLFKQGEYKLALLSRLHVRNPSHYRYKLNMFDEKRRGRQAI